MLGAARDDDLVAHCEEGGAKICRFPLLEYIFFCLNEN
jgi:hypothetical protein